MEYNGLKVIVQKIKEVTKMAWSIVKAGLISLLPGHFAFPITIILGLISLTFLFKSENILNKLATMGAVAMVFYLLYVMLNSVRMVF